MDTNSAAVAPYEPRRHRTPPTVSKAAAPWLIFPHGKDMNYQAFYNICDPQATSYNKSIPELRGKSFWQKTSHRNWLIILCQEKSYESMHRLDNWNHGDCFLWNLASLEHIQLPSLVEWISKPEKYVLIDCVLTSPPNSSHYKDEDSMTIFLVGALLNTLLLLFCLPGDKQWKIKRISREDITGVNVCYDLVSLHYFKGKLYVTFVKGGCLLELEKQHILDNNIKNLSVRSHDMVIGNREISPLGLDYTDRYYVESDDDFFMIWVSYNSRCKQVTSIYVWRLDLPSIKWEEVGDLGDHVIFAGTSTGFCCSAAELGLKSGALYYTLGGDQSLYKFEVKGGNAVILPCPELQTPWFQSQWIMMIPEDGMEKNCTKQQQQQQEDFRLEEVEENKIFTTSYTDRSHDKQSKEEISPWDSLSEDMVVVISTYLHPLDYVHFRSVCKANRKVMPPTTQKQKSNSTGYPYISPWLMFPRGNTYTFVDPVHDNETYLMSFCELVQGAKILYQKDGWLLMSRSREKFFFNPFTREIIELPDFPDGYNISIISFTDSPTTPNCAVFAIDQTAPLDICILIIMRGDDIWLPIDFPYTNVEKQLMPLHGTAPIMYKDGFYFVDCDGTLGFFNVMKNGVSSVLEKPKKIFKNDMHPNLLVECGRDLLLVKIGHLGTAVRIYRLDLSEMEWVKVESLGKHMLFISETSCISAIAPNNRMKNMIYFPRVYLNGGGILSYSLETGIYHSSSGKNQDSHKNSFYETEGWLSNCTWIQPNWAKSTEQELDWLKPL